MSRLGVGGWVSRHCFYNRNSYLGSRPGPRLNILRGGETPAIGLLEHGGHLERPADVTLPNTRDTKNHGLFGAGRPSKRVRFAGGL